MWSLIGNTLGFVRETITRRFKAKHKRSWSQNEVDIKEALANSDVNRIRSIFKRLRMKGHSSERR